MNNIMSYFKYSKLELLKVIFPNKQQIKNAFIVVLGVVTVVSLYLALVDVIMSFTVQKLVGN